ncbi:MAG: FAD synthase [Rikenellaceae bacterium]|nr:FAD synthase [Rikenellaceae bacterium]
MQIIRDITLFPQQSSVVTVGSFDGVHRGHQALLRALVAEAKEQGSLAVVVSFETHPRIALGRGEGLHLLTSLEQKAALLDQFGVDCLVLLPFNEAFSKMSGEEFVTSILVEQLHANTLIAGYNHRFGHDRIEAATLRYEGLRVVRIEREEVEGAKVSSSEIRRLLAEGRTAEAEKLLGHNQYQQP